MAPAVVRHRPGVGAAVAVAGLMLLLLSLFSFPWISEGGGDVTFGDIRDQFEVMDDLATTPNEDVVFMEVYAEFLWIYVVVAAVAAVVFSTLVVPSSTGGRAVTGFLVGGVVGLVVNVVDREGRVGPRLTAAVAVLACAGMHGLAVADLFGEEFMPDPAWGVWAGVAGLALMFTGCLAGTRTETDPAYR